METKSVTFHGVLAGAYRGKDVSARAQHLDCDLIYPEQLFDRADASVGALYERAANAGGSPEDFRRLLDEVSVQDKFPYRGIVHCWSLDAVPADEWTADSRQSAGDLACLSTLHLVQALAQTGWRDAPRLWLVTRGAQMVRAEDGPPAVAQAPLWGLARTIAYEHPELACTRIDLDPQTADVQAFLRELGAGDREDQVILRGDSRFVARLARMTPDSPSRRREETLEPPLEPPELEPGAVDEDEIAPLRLLPRLLVKPVRPRLEPKSWLPWYQLGVAALCWPSVGRASAKRRAQACSTSSAKA
jgi:hypothetical protein